MIRITDYLRDYTMKQSKDLFKGWPQTKVNERNETITVTPKYTSPGVVGLRKKLGSCAKYVQTVRGVGYRFKDNQ